MSFNPRCPFHTAVATAAAIAAVSFIYLRITRKNIERFDVDARFTDAVRYGDLVFISGQVGEIGETIEEQTRSALASVDAALAKAGTDKSKILEATIWLANIVDDYNGMNKVYDSWIVSGKPPARACIQAKLASENYRIEIRVIAAK
jgi:enamine deaminase RidA (YjgF/YER057c/UK114 family)